LKDSFAYRLFFFIYLLGKPVREQEVDEVADYFAISVRTVYRLIDEGELKRTKIRGCLRIPVWKIERYAKEIEEQGDEP